MVRIEETPENKKYKEEQKLRMDSYVVGDNDSNGNKIKEIYLLSCLFGICFSIHSLFNYNLFLSRYQYR